jgi:hypothetical protein
VLIACDLAHAHDAYRNLLRHVPASMIITLHRSRFLYRGRSRSPPLFNSHTILRTIWRKYS